MIDAQDELTKEAHPSMFIELNKLTFFYNRDKIRKCNNKKGTLNHIEQYSVKTVLTRFLSCAHIF